MEAKGKGFLKVSGILLIIFGGLGIALLLLALLGSGLMAANPQIYEQASAATAETVQMLSAGAMVALSVLSIVFAAIHLIGGIVGVKNCNNLRKAQNCFIWGIILIVVQVLGTISDVITSGITVWTIISLIIGLVLPIIYTYGALQNKKQQAIEP